MTDPLDTITIELPREVAEAHGFGVTTREQRLEVDFACRKALANPTRSDEGLRLAAERLVASVENAMSYGDSLDESAGFEKALENLRTALSQTPGGAQEDAIREAHTLTNPDVRKGIEEANKKISAWKKEIEDPPPTAPGEASQEVSESVDCSRGGDLLTHLRLAHRAATNPSETPSNLDQESEVQENLGGPYRVVGRCGDWSITGPLLRGDGTSGYFTRKRAQASADFYNAAYTEGYKAAQNEAKVATSPKSQGAMAEWQPIETAPKDELLLVGYRGGSASSTGFARLFEGGWFSDTSIRCPDPTHWMPRPAPPSEGSES